MHSRANPVVHGRPCSRILSRPRYPRCRPMSPGTRAVHRHPGLAPDVFQTPCGPPLQRQPPWPTRFRHVRGRPQCRCGSIPGLPGGPHNHATSRCSISRPVDSRTKRRNLVRRPVSSMPWCLSTIGPGNSTLPPNRSSRRSATTETPPTLFPPHRLPAPEEIVPPPRPVIRRGGRSGYPVSWRRRTGSTTTSLHSIPPSRPAPASAWNGSAREPPRISRPCGTHLDGRRAPVAGLLPGG